MSEEPPLTFETLTTLSITEMKNDIATVFSEEAVNDYQYNLRLAGVPGGSIDNFVRSTLKIQEYINSYLTRCQENKLPDEIPQEARSIVGIGIPAILLNNGLNDFINLLPHSMSIGFSPDNAFLQIETQLRFVISRYQQLLPMRHNSLAPFVEVLDSVFTDILTLLSDTEKNDDQKLIELSQYHDKIRDHSYQLWGGTADFDVPSEDEQLFRYLMNLGRELIATTPNFERVPERPEKLQNI